MCVNKVVQTSASDIGNTVWDTIRGPLVDILLLLLQAGVIALIGCVYLLPDFTIDPTLCPGVGSSRRFLVW